MPKVVHFEIPADDLDRAKAFYSAVFGWQLQTMPMAGVSTRRSSPRRWTRRPSSQPSRARSTAA